MKQSENVTFRLPLPLYNELLQWAEAEKTSDGLLARRLVIEGLRRHSLSEELALLHEQIAEMRKDLAIATQAVLVNGGKTKADDAKAWVKQNLRSPN